MDALINLRQQLEDSGGILKINNHGSTIEFKCTFKPPAKEEQIVTVEKALGFKIPDSYYNFLLFSNGCLLFEHPEYSSEEIIYGTGDLLFYNEELHNDGLHNRIRIAKIDFSQILIDENDCIFVRENLAPFDKIYSLHCNFNTWIDRYITGNGLRYWDSTV